MSEPGPWVTADNASLVTDLYEVTMAAAYHAERMTAPASFELFVRRLPDERNFLVVCGVEHVLDVLEQWRFDGAALQYLRTLDRFSADFLEHLGGLRFSGDVWAMPEGELVFGGEPVLRVTAPLIEAQLVETLLLTTVLFQTMVASKAARVAIAAQGRPFVDFSGRRDHGPDAALKAARAAYIGGAQATSNVLAGHLFGIPVSGTMAHAYVMSFASETDAFVSFARRFPGQAVLLIDTYDTEQGARRVVEAAAELARDGISIQAVRLDSGDLGQLAKSVRSILDDGGLRDVRIFASGDLDERKIAELLAGGAPIDAFGVGTQLGTSGDAPSLSGVYKLVEDEHGPKAKFSPGKQSWPGRKQVFRHSDHDLVALADEPAGGGRPLLTQVMAGGRRSTEAEGLEAARRRCSDAVAGLPDELRLLGRQADWPVRQSSALQALAAEVNSRRR